ncbi:MAG TPA: hypothetical protein VKT31_13635 [Solirubrobacteraceae bacterium]|nr:hypothetical protein [Solirubrobacteraceae bacterium]
MASTAALLVMSQTALAAPVSIDFESGASVGDQITNQYATPSGIPEGPTFMQPGSAGFTPFGCGAGHLTNATAHSGSNSVVLDGCSGGGEFSPTATFFSMGYTTDSVSFWVAVGAQIFNGSSDTVVTTAFDSNRHEIAQVITTLGPQSGPAFQQVSISSTSFNIAFVAVEEGQPGTNSSSPTGVGDTVVDLSSAPLYVDDLTYDPPATPPGSSFVLGATPAGTSTTDGAQAQIAIPITWSNNPDPSADPVTLSANTPTGVTASFSPNPTNTGTSTLTLTVAKTAPLGNYNVLVTGTSGSETEQVGIPFGISAAFQPVSPGAITVLPCTTRQVTLNVDTGGSFSQPITLYVTTTNQPGVTITGISGNGGSGTITSATQAHVTVTPQNGVATATLSLSAGAGGGPENGPQVIGLDAASSGYADQSDTSGTLAVGQSQVSFVYAPSGARTPQALQPGSSVTISGQGFCPGSTVQFGNALALATPTSVSGTSIQVRVPQLATSGPVEVLTGSPAVASAPSSQSLNVDSYRNTNAWAFHNYVPSGFDLGELTDLFGVNQTFFTVNPCWPFGTCNIPLFPTPTSGIMLAVADGVLANGTSGGACFGFSLSTQRILEGLEPLYLFNPGGSTINSVDSPSGPSAFTERYINTQAMAQFSRDYLTQYLAANINQGAVSAAQAVDDVHSEVEGVLAQGRYPLIALHDAPSGGGHLVIAYNVEDVGPHEYYIDVYDSNEPFGWNGHTPVPSTELAPDGNQHQANFAASRVHVMPDGSWSLPSTGFSGHQTDIVVTDPASIPLHPTMPDALPGSFVYFGSAGPVGTGSTSAPAPPSHTTQLTGSGGRTLYGANGQLNSNSATRLDAAPFAPAVGAGTARHEMFVLGRGASDFRQTLVGTGSGADSYTLLGPGLIARIDTRAAKGITDQLTLNPSANRIGFSTAAAHAPVTLTMTGTGGGASHTAAVATTSFRGAGDALSFNDSHTSLTFVHEGPATAFTITLSSLQRNGGPSSFSSGTLRIGDGQTAQISGVSWSGLAGGTLRVRIGGHTITVANHLHIAKLARIARVRATHGRHGVTLALTARLARLPRGATVAFIWVVRSGGRIVATRAVPVTAAIGKVVTRTWTFKARRSRHYQLVARVMVIVPGSLGAVSSSVAVAGTSF